MNKVAFDEFDLENFGYEEPKLIDVEELVDSLIEDGEIKPKDRERKIAEYEKKNNDEREKHLAENSVLNSDGELLDINKVRNSQEYTENNKTTMHEIFNISRPQEEFEAFVHVYKNYPSD